MNGGVMAAKTAQSKSARPFDATEKRTELLALAVESIKGTPAPQRAQLIAQARALITEISGPTEAAVPSGAGGESGVVSFREKLEARRANPKGKGRPRKSS